MDYSIQIENFMKLVSEFNKFSEESKIPNPDKGSIAVMSKLYFSKEMYSCQLAKELNLSRARLSLIVKGLKNKKYVTCHYHLTDKRKILIKITQDGAKIVKDTYDMAIKKIKRLFEKLGTDKTNSLIEVLSETVEIIKEDREETKICLD